MSDAFAEARDLVGGTADAGPTISGIRFWPLEMHRDERGDLAEVLRHEWETGLASVQWTVLRNVPRSPRARSTLLVESTSHYDPEDRLPSHCADSELGLDWHAEPEVVSELDRNAPAARLAGRPDRARAAVLTGSPVAVPQTVAPSVPARVLAHRVYGGPGTA